MADAATENIESSLRNNGRARSDPTNPHGGTYTFGQGEMGTGDDTGTRVVPVESRPFLGPSSANTGGGRVDTSWQHTGFRVPPPSMNQVQPAYLKNQVPRSSGVLGPFREIAPTPSTHRQRLGATTVGLGGSGLQGTTNSVTDAGLAGGGRNVGRFADSRRPLDGGSSSNSGDNRQFANVGLRSGMKSGSMANSQTRNHAASMSPPNQLFY